jgi:nucleoside recognition membrane protein YjiH
MAALLAEAVTQAFRTLLLVAGYMTLAAVALALLRETGGLGPLARAFGALLALFSLPPSLGEAVTEGLVEMTLGTSRACQSSAPLGDRLTVASMILGWSGLSVHGQVASVLAGTDLRLGPYLLSRIAQGLLAAVLIRLWLPEAVPTFQLPRPATWSPLLVFELSLLLLGLGLALWLLLALLFALFRRSWYGGL